MAKGQTRKGRIARTIRGRIKDIETRNWNDDTLSPKETMECNIGDLLLLDMPLNKEVAHAITKWEDKLNRNGGGQ